MKISIGCDHGAYDLKETLKNQFDKEQAKTAIENYSALLEKRETKRIGKSKVYERKRTVDSNNRKNKE